MSESVGIYGITDATMAAHADAKATREALQLAALADSVWPASDRRMIELVAELMIEHCLAFAINARRNLSAVRVDGILVPDLSGRLAKRFVVESFNGSLWRALQMIVHAKSIIVVPINTDEDRFEKAGALRICYLKVVEERGVEAYVCPFGLAHSYLGRHGRTDKGI